ncbi:adenine deaminase C-terminal domain-containing protein [Metabacillus indicus]|uniref:adenine deaminase n=1 Tax=Metabacillus indicus TaxID=246786 RepID=A0A084H1E4_METID|nr:adenine deaminase C-terminal domain-containing protein [Metabacillus indicus]KEZ53406.1 adenine deaminase [Metabacillus indicus]
MPKPNAPWKIREIRGHIDAASGQEPPDLLLKNGTYLNSYLKRWVKAHIWIKDDRIVYIGENLPASAKETADCEGQFIVPGYIEPHAHPFQLYNPPSFGEYVSQFGTTSMICDNLFLLFQSDKKKAFSFLEEINRSQVQYYWWARFDLQTEVPDETGILSLDFMKKWMDSEYVIQGGELTGWPKLLQDDDLMLSWMKEIKGKGKRIEGHFPGASAGTLTKMKLFGADCDHEAMTGGDVVERLSLGYTVALRHSSIRPDLPELLKGIREKEITSYDHFFFTTDGSTPHFYKDGMIDSLIKMAMESGIPAVDAYHMASFNAARYYRMEEVTGAVAPGRMANLNILSAIDQPLPASVLAKGKWLKKAGVAAEFPSFDWKQTGLEPLQLNWSLSLNDLQFSMAMGLKMKNDVIIEPYRITVDHSFDELSDSHDECFLALIDKRGKWRINTMLKGFASSLGGLASSYSTTGDIILIGKSKHDMITAFQRMKELGGGIVLAEKGEVLHEIPLGIGGGASLQPFQEVVNQEETFRSLLAERGYLFGDPVYSLFFLLSTHLPYIRITPAGIYDVLKKIILFPPIMR